MQQQKQKRQKNQMALTFPQKLPVNIKRCPSDGTTVKQQESVFVILFSFKNKKKNNVRCVHSAPAER